MPRTIRHSRTDTRLFHGTAVSRHAQPLRDIRTRKNFQTARTGINPATKQKITIAAKKVVKFKAGAELADKVK